ncbi:hypothetical protein DRF59_15070 [Chryseobacterium flavum]|uniref:Uncharacterized protein n=1 Tax=Chryseobacterium flavum TaxID=415851 RepID=A0A3D9CJ51_9FLAO|nr:hypothetical protein [Chryseobacterium flavum]REC65777.1 hypothetical protein DRF59_15070 [Chryseobacterium flavum]
MKIVYITSLLFLSSVIYAQESNKQAAPAEDQSQVLKQAKEQQTRILKENQESTEKTTTGTALVSDQGLAVKKQESKQKVPADHSGKLLSNTVSLEELKKTIPNRQASRNTTHSRNTNNTIGLPNTATLEEIKKTIPKN